MSTSNLELFGNTLKECRRLAGLTQEELALELKFESGSMISRYENRKNLPPQNILDDIVRILRENGTPENCIEDLIRYSGYGESYITHPTLTSFARLLGNHKMDPRDRYFLEECLKDLLEYFQRYQNAYIDLNSPLYLDSIPAFENLLLITDPDMAEKWPNVKRLRLRVLLRLARAKRLSAELDDAIGFLIEAERVARQFAEKERYLLAMVLLERGDNYRRQSRWDRARADYTNSYQVFKDVEIAEGEKQVRYYAIIERKLAGTHLFEGQPIEAQENCKRSLFHCRNLQDLKGELKGLQHQAWAYSMLGFWSEALKIHIDVVDALKRYPMDTFTLVKGKRYLGEIYRTCGIYRKAKEIYDDAEKDLWDYYKGEIKRDQLVYGMILHGQGAVNRVLQGEPGLAEKQLTDSLNIHIKLKAKYHEGLNHSELGKLALQENNYSRAQYKFEKAKEIFDQLNNAYYIIAQKYNLAFLKYCQNNYPEARAHANWAIQQAEIHKFDVHMARAKLLLAKINLAEPDIDQPVDLFISAFQLARNLNPFLVHEILSQITSKSHIIEQEGDIQSNLLRLCDEITNKGENILNNVSFQKTPGQSWLQVVANYREKLVKSLYLPPSSLGQSFALIIGVGNYSYMRPLTKTTTDAHDLYNLLIQNGYLTSNLSLLIDEKATKELINNALDDLARHVDNQDTVLIFFAGHGARRKGGFEPGEYLCPINADWNRLHMTAISNNEFTTALEALPSHRVVVFLDACHSGGVGEPRNPALAVEPGLTDLTYKQLLSVGEGRIVIASCGPNEVSWELQEMRNGLFTHYLLEGLRGAAASEDGAVRILDLYKYIAQEVPKRAPLPQTPLLKANTNLNYPIFLPKPSVNT